jgi:hypothetical protein
MVEINDEFFDVRFTANCYMMNDGIGHYDYMGNSEYDAGRNYVEMEEVEWDEFLYTLEENNAIRKATKTLDFYKEFEAEYLEAIKP